MSEQHDKHNHYVAVTALIRNLTGDRILIAQRHKHDDMFAGKWCFPGGKVERGENLTTALEREVLEEVGLTIHKHKKLLRDFTFVRSSGHQVICLSFAVQALHENIVLGKDIADARWILPPHITNYDCLSGMREEVMELFHER